MNVDATRRLNAAKGDHAAAVQTANRGLTRAVAHQDWLKDLRMDGLATYADKAAASRKVADLTETLGWLVLDAPTGTFTPDQVATARWAIGS